MKRKRILVLICSVLTLTFLLSGCSLFSSNDDMSPIGAIQDAYGNTQYKISFSSEGLDTPISELYYTAYDIPKLPTPEKVGYIFAGWYFDRAFTIPYENDALYLYMSNVTLYAKWIKEEFESNGTYAIEYDTKIVDGTVSKGALSDVLGYKDFSTAIIEEDTYIEKTDEGLFLKIHYDNGTTVPFDATSTVFNIGVSAQTNGSVRITEAITAETETVKTIWLDISKFNLSDTLYLNVTYVDWVTENLTEEERKQSVTTYIVSFDITRLIGFDKPFVDITKPLDDGDYLVKSYFYDIDGKATMLDTYNSVYSYIHAEKGNYTFIKPFAPYFGLMQDFYGSADYESNFYSRLSTYYKIWFAFTAEISEAGEDIYADLENKFNAGKFLKTTYEFDADTGKCYNTFYLGNDLTKDIVLMGLASGFMEAAMGTAPTYKKVVFDFDTIVKVSDSGYKELSGDNYSYTQDMQAYPFDYNDFSLQNTAYDLVEQYGLTENLNMFFFSSSDSVIDVNTVGSKKYSSKITITPYGSAAVTDVKDMRNILAQFSVCNQIYGYNAKDYDLCSQSMAVRTFGGYSLFDKNRIRTGQSCKIGEYIDLLKVFEENVFTDVEIDKISFTAYRIKNGAVDFTNPVSIADTFNFSEDIAVLYTYTDNYVTTYLHEFVMYSDPEITVYNYDETSTYRIGDIVPTPYISSSWMGKEEEFCYRWAASDSADANISPLRVVVFYINDSDSVYSIETSWFPDMSLSPCTFKMTAHTLIGYEVTNPFGERYYYYFEFSAESSELPVWSVKEDGGDILFSNDITFTTVNGEILRENVNEKTETIILKDIEEIDRELNKGYIFTLYGTENEMTLSEIIIKMPENCYTLSAKDYTISQLKSAIKAYMSNAEYSYLEFVYGYEDESAISKDTISVVYIYNFTFDGKPEPTIIKYDAYFTGRSYSFVAPSLLSKSGVTLGHGSLSLQYYKNSSYSSVPSTAAIFRNSTAEFFKPGDYRLTYTVNILYNENGKLTFGNERNSTKLVFYLYFKVLDGNGEVTVTYVSDEEHPFLDGSTEMTITYSLTGNVISLGTSSFASSQDMLYAWGLYPDTNFRDSSNYIFAKNGVLQENIISDFISTFNTDHLILYAIWDKGIDIVVHISETESITKKIYLENYSIFTGYYSLSLELSSYLSNGAPAGYIHAGWSGDIFENGFIQDTEGFYKIYEECEITVVYSILLTVKYNINSQYSTTRKANDRNIIDNFTLLQSLGESAVNSRMSVSSKSGYTFRYWAVMIDGEMIEFNLYEDTISSSMADGSTFNLYAVFEDEGGELVW